MPLNAALSDSASVLFSLEMPALLTAMSRRPCLATMASTILRTAASSVTSLRTKNGPLRDASAPAISAPAWVPSGGPRFREQ